MNTENQIRISKDKFEKLKKLSGITQISINQIINKILEDFFLLLRDQPEIFIEEAGIYEQIRKIVDS